MIRCRSGYLLIVLICDGDALEGGFEVGGVHCDGEDAGVNERSRRLKVTGIE